MNILYCGDKGISRGVLVSILSLLMRGKKNNIYNIYIMTIKYEGVNPFEEKTAKFQLMIQYFIYCGMITTSKSS